MPSSTSTRATPPVPGIQCHPASFSLNWRGSHKTLTSPSHHSAPSSLPFTPLHNNDDKQRQRTNNHQPSSVFHVYRYLDNTPTPKGRGGFPSLASVRAGFTPTDLLVRAGNKRHQKQLCKDRICQQTITTLKPELCSILDTQLTSWKDFRQGGVCDSLRVRSATSTTPTTSSASSTPIAQLTSWKDFHQGGVCDSLEVRSTLRRLQHFSLDPGTRLGGV